MPLRFRLMSALCPVIPDLDVAGFGYGVSYEHFFGHRGFFHSVFFAMFAGVVCAIIYLWNCNASLKRKWLFSVYFFLLTASNGILDAFTNGGLGVALLSPFDNTRYFWPWRPIHVSPIGLGTFFSKYGIIALKSEFIWVWVPCLTVLLFVIVFRCLFVRKN